MTRRFLLLGILFHTLLYSGFAQSRLPVNRYRGEEMLQAVKYDLERNYYDPSFRGMNLDLRFKAALQKIKRAESNGSIYAIIAQLLSELNDSHTVFLPPSWRLKVDYGFRLKTIGERCFVVSVSSDSDAALKGIVPGDEIVSIDGFAPSRDNLWKIKYSYFRLQPRHGMALELRRQDGTTRNVSLNMKTISGDELDRERRRLKPLSLPQYFQLTDRIVICKFPHFEFEPNELDGVFKKIGNSGTLILDLRENPGGRQEALQRFVGYFFDHDVKIADLKQRGNLKPLTAQPIAKRNFAGRLFLLVDSDSASSAELFARTIQLQKRGFLIGDRTAGDVMAARIYSHRFKSPPDDDWSFMWFGVEVTVADCLMPDSKTLEGVGVIPDEMVLPTSRELSASHDPALSRAVHLAGGHLTAQDAGSLWSRIRELDEKR